MRKLAWELGKQAVRYYKGNYQDSSGFSKANAQGGTKRRRGSDTYTKPVGKFKDARSGQGKAIKIRKPKRAKKKQPSLKKRVKELEKDIHFGVNEERLISSGQFLATQNVAVYREETLWDVATMNGQIDALEYISRTGTGGLTNLDLTGTNITRDNWLDINCWSEITCANNFDIPVKLTMYCFVPKLDLSTNIVNTINAGDAAIGISGASTDILMYPSDIPLVRSQWDCVKTAKATLRGGDTMSMSYSQDMRWNSKLIIDRGTPTYPKRKAAIILLRLEGVLCHDSTTTSQVGQADGGIDFIKKRKFKVKYPSDARIYKLGTTNSLTNMTAAPTVTGPNVIKIDDTA